MKIALLSPFEEPVPPKKYGGTELVVYNLCEELKKLGHKVYLIASGDSKTSAELLPIFPKAIRKLPLANDMKIRESLKFIGVGRTLSYLKDLKIDIIHNHIGWRMLSFARLFKTPFVTTLHGPLDIEYQKVVYGAFAYSPFVSISNSQRHPFKKLNYVATVYNGIDIKKFVYSETSSDYFAFLGRMSPEKGPVQAIEIAKKTGVRLVMAAKIDKIDKIFFEKEVAPMIDNKQIVYLGEVNHRGKVNLLKNAKALFAPIQWREPFGLFFIEAMACGTPAITYRMGSAAEVVKNGKTGYVVNNETEFIEAVRHIDSIKREDCRIWVEKNFTSEIMASNYVKVYESVIQAAKRKE